ncbi:MAG: radical SAM protein [Candidatus Methanofastidiosia archaeon]|jgi:uncharacterized protein
MYVSKYNVVVDVGGHKEKILINPLSQSIDVVDGDDKDLLTFLKGESSFKKLNVDREYLLERGYLFNSEEEEKTLLYNIIKIDDQEKYPCDFLLYPTFTCNFRCTYCFQEPHKKYSFISKDYVNKVFEAIEKICRDLQIESRPLMYLFGGEPLLKGRKPEEILRYTLSQAYHKGYRTAIVTNGSNVAYYASLIKKYNVEFIQITLDGPRHIHDTRRVYANGKETFDDIVKGIESVIDSEIKILIRINLDSQNIDYLPEFADFVLDSGWDKDNVIVFVGPYRDLLCRSYEYQLPEHIMLKRIFAFYEENPCTKIINLRGWPGADYILHFVETHTLPPPRVSYCIAHYGRFGFDADGYVYACGNASGKKEYAIGRYYPEFTIDDSKASVWRKKRFIVMPECTECAIAPMCGGGCILQSLLKYEGKTPFCPEILENLTAAVTYYFDKIVGE